MHNNYNRLVRALKRSGLPIHHRMILDHITMRGNKKLTSLKVLMEDQPKLKAQFFGSHLQYYFEVAMLQDESPKPIYCRFDGEVFEQFGHLLFSHDAMEITGIFEKVSPRYTVFLIKSVQRWYPTQTFGETLVATLHRLF